MSSSGADRQNHILTPGPVDTWRWLPWVLTVLFVAAIICIATTGLEDTLAPLGTSLADGMLSLVVTAPLLFFALRGRPKAWRVIAVLAALILLSRWALNLPRIGVFADLQWNWQGKGLELIWLAILFAVLWRWARTEAGLTWRTRPNSTARVVVVIVIVFFISGALTFWALADAVAPASPPSIERLLFDSTYPNLTEELLVRGALIAVLDRACGTPRRFFGAQVGWGLVITTVWFGLWHGLMLSPDGPLFDPWSILATGLVGLLLGWVRARSGVIWLAFIAHCAPELGADTAQALWATSAG